MRCDDFYKHAAPLALEPLSILTENYARASSNVDLHDVGGFAVYGEGDVYVTASDE